MEITTGVTALAKTLPQSIRNIKGILTGKMIQSVEGAGRISIPNPDGLVTAPRAAKYWRLAHEVLVEIKPGTQTGLAALTVNDTAQLGVGGMNLYNEIVNSRETYPNIPRKTAGSEARFLMENKMHESARIEYPPVLITEEMLDNGEVNIPH